MTVMTEKTFIEEYIAKKCIDFAQELVKFQAHRDEDHYYSLMKKYLIVSALFNDKMNREGYINKMRGELSTKMTTAALQDLVSELKSASKQGIIKEE